ncbi:MAG: DUF2232 domain-containing protein [Candidatus Binatia bacterium]
MDRDPSIGESKRAREAAPPLDPRPLLRAWVSTSALYLSGVFLPVGGVLLMLFTPQPGLRLEPRGGMASLLALVALVAMTAAVFGGATAAVFYLAGFALLTLALPIGLRRGWSLEFTVGTTTLLLAATTALVLFGMVMTPSELAGALDGALEDGRATLLEMYRQAGVAPSRIDQLREATAAFVDAMVRLAPAAVVIALGVTVLLNLVVVRRRQARSGHFPIFGDLTRWRAPWPLVWMLIATGYGAVVLTGDVRTAALNGFAVTLAVYFLQGLAIVQFYLDRWQLPWWTRTLLWVVIAVEWLLAAGVVLLGVFDLWADFRRLTPRPVEDDE